MRSKFPYVLSIGWLFCAIVVLVLLYISQNRFEDAIAVIVAWCGGIFSYAIYIRGRQ